MDRVDAGAGFSVLDGGALVMGSAIASVHILCATRGDLSGAGWFMMGLTFTWVAITAAGPFIFLARRFARRLSNYPKMGDWLWALLGIPWLASAVLQSAAPGSEPRPNPLFAMTLSIGLAIVCMIAVIRRLEHLGYGPPRSGRAGRGGSLDQSRRPDLSNRLASPMWCGHDRLELRLPAFVGQAFLPDTHPSCQARRA